MSMLAFFIAHERITQLRSMRFRGLAIAYVIAACVAPVAVFLSERRIVSTLGPGGYNTILMIAQPLLTSILAAGLAIDSIARERDEGSFAVLSVAPISSAGYLLRRWIAIVAICLPISLVPTIVTAALAIRSRATVPLIAMFAESWLLYILPALLAGSAFAIALGTITGRTVLAIITGLLMLSFGLGEINEILFRTARITFGGAGAPFGTINNPRLIWLIRGYGLYDFPSDAAFPWHAELRMLPVRMGITAVVIALCLGGASFYLRRTRRDLRPWQIPETHQLRSMLRMFNRYREEFAPDSGSTIADRATFGVSCFLAISLIVFLVHRTSAFAKLGAARYVAETTTAEATDPTIVADAMTVDVDIDRAGRVRSRAAIAIRNDGPQPRSHLSFDLNPLMNVQHAAADTGGTKINRVWRRLDVDLDPPLAPKRSRRLTFDVEGMPGEVEFALQAPGRFPAQWHRYITAKQSIYFTDLSQSVVAPAVSEVRADLSANDVAPVIRYSPWTLQSDERNEEGFVPESIMTNTNVTVRVRHPFAVALDSCGAIAQSTLASRCNAVLPSYVIFGGPFVQQTLAPGVAVTYIPAHETVARAQMASFRSAVRLAANAWPALQLPSRITFVERPREVGRREWFDERSPTNTVRQVAASGALIMLPESLFTRTKVVSPNILAAAILAGTLRDKRRVVSSESLLFGHLYSVIAVGRLGIRKMRATEMPGGGPPQTGPLVSAWWSDNRLTRVLLDVEYRVGATHFLEGVQDFINRRGAGTAKELLAAIGSRGSVDLSRTYDDYFIGTALPQLTLVDVKFTRNGDRWDVSGSVKNEATGQAFTPVALRTSQGTLWKTVRVDSHEVVPFAFSTSGEPRSVQLDPEQVCYRYAAIGTTDVVDNRGTS